MKKIVLGNDFNLIIPVSRKVHTSTGDVIQDFNLLPACTDLQVNLVNFNETISLSCSVDVEHTSRLIANVDSSKLNIGNYALEVKGKIYGNAWRSNEYEQIAFVNNNASADEVFDGEIIEGESSVEVDHVFILLPPSADLTQLIDQASATIDKTNEALDKVTDAINKAETVDIDLNDTELEITRNSGEKKNFDLNTLKGEKGDGGKVQDVLVYGKSALVDNNTVNITNIGLLRCGTSYISPYLMDNQINQDIDKDNAIALGYEAVVNGNEAIALGHKASASGISIGSNTSSTYIYNIAIGEYASAMGINSIAIGYSASSTGGYSGKSIAIGGYSEASGAYSIALGTNAYVKRNGNEAIALGYEAVVYERSEKSIAIGYRANVSDMASNTIVIGSDAIANNEGSVVIGSDAYTKYTYSVAIGYMARNLASSSVAIGNRATVEGSEDAIAIGNMATAKYSHSIVIGHNLPTDLSKFTIGLNEVNIIDMTSNNELYLIGLGGYTGTNLVVNGNLNPDIKSVHDLIKEKVVKETVDFIADATTAEDVVTKFNQLLANLRSAGIMRSE